MLLSPITCCTYYKRACPLEGLLFLTETRTANDNEASKGKSDIRFILGNGLIHG